MIQTTQRTVSAYLSEPPARKLFLFALVGGVGTVINTALLFLLTTYAGFHYLFAAMLATEVAIISNFIGNNLFTFNDSTNVDQIWKKFVKFQLDRLVGLGSTLLVLWAVTTLFGLKLLLV